MTARRKIAAFAVALWCAVPLVVSAQIPTLRTMEPDIHVWVHFSVSGDISISAWSRNSGRELAPVLPKIVHCPGIARPDGPNFNSIRCSNALQTDGSVLDGVVDLAPIAQSLDPSTQVELWVYCPSLGFSSSSIPMTVEDIGASHMSRSIRFQAGNAPTAFHIRFGYLPGQLDKIFLPLLALALAFTLIAVFMARAGLAVLGRSAVMLGTIVWVAASAQLGADDALRVLLLGSFFANLAAVLLQFWPPLLCIACGVALGSWMRPAQARKSDAGRLLTSLAIIPLLLTSAAGAFPSFTNGTWTHAVLWLAAAPVFLLLRIAVVRARGNSTRRLATGELKERLSALASRAGCPQVKIYVSFSRRLETSNAFAMPGRFILLTAPLIRSLSKREVDAVAAHELSHFRHSNRGVWMALVFAMLMSIAPIRDLFLTVPGGLFTVMLVPIGVYLAAMRGMRRREFAADAGAVALTGDPAAMISSLARMDRNNGGLRMPAAAVCLSDHPPLPRRIAAIARAAQLDAAEVKRLIDAGDPGERYELPEKAGGALVFSLAWQNANAGVYSWLVLLGSSGSGVLAAWLLTRFGVYGVVPFLAAIVFGCVVTKGLASAWSAINYARLRRRLEARFGVSGEIIGLALDSEPRIYNGFRFSDAGLLRFADGRLCYTSERISIALNPADVTEVGLVAASPSNWVRRQPMVRFRHPESGAIHAFIIHPVGWLPTQGRLLNRIRQWRSTQTSPESTSIAGFNPVAGQGFSPLTVAGAVRGFRVTGSFTLAMSVLALLSGQADWRFVACALAVAAGSYLFMLLPSMLYRPPALSPSLPAPAEAKN